MSTFCTQQGFFYTFFLCFLFALYLLCSRDETLGTIMKKPQHASTAHGMNILCIPSFGFQVDIGWTGPARAVTVSIPSLWIQAPHVDDCIARCWASILMRWYIQTPISLVAIHFAIGPSLHRRWSCDKHFIWPLSSAYESFGRLLMRFDILTFYCRHN